MKKGFILFSFILASLFVSSTDIEATSVREMSYTEINEFNGFTNVVIFIRFNDEASYQAPFNFAHYESMFNGVDQVSLRDYFLEVSYNQFTIDTIFTHEEIVFYQDSYDRGYYIEYDESTNPDGYQNDDEKETREHELLENAVAWVETNNLIPDTIDLDVNNDNDIDSLTFMVSGEDDGWNNLLWPHKWELKGTTSAQINGVYAHDYTFELLGNHQYYNYGVDVAVLAHETFHLISAPDLYHYYDFEWIDAIGEWGLMATIGDVPSHMLGYMKYQYGNWIDDAQDITESGQYTLHPIQDDGTNMYKIPLGYSNEYLYIEYRDNEGLYESTLPSTGLLVYRVDKDFIDDGNVYGYYDETAAAEEVWVYRPNMEDTTYPIEFSLDEPVHGDEDGSPYYSGLSDNNTYNEIGVGTDILLFDSAGDEINIKITNVQEHDGYITFYVYLDDSALPEIKLNGSEHMTLEYEAYFRDPGYTVTVDGYTVEVEGSVDVYTLGDYTLTYTLKDSEGIIIETKTRTVSIVDTTLPRADIKVGLDTIGIGEDWVDGGVLVSDNEDTELTIEVSSELDNTIEGTYLVEYKVIDNAGNYVKVNRYVTVKAKEYNFVEEFVCFESITTFTAGETLVAPRCEYNGEALVATNLSEINNRQPGVYEVLYEVTIEEETHLFASYIFVIYEYSDIVAIIPEERRKDL